MKKLLVFSLALLLVVSAGFSVLALHRNPGHHDQIYPGTDDSGFTNGEASESSPAVDVVIEKNKNVDEGNVYYKSEFDNPSDKN